MKTAFILLLGFGGLTTLKCNSNKSKESAQMIKSHDMNLEAKGMKVALFGPIIVKSNRTV